MGIFYGVLHHFIISPMYKKRRTWCWKVEWNLNKMVIRKQEERDWDACKHCTCNLLLITFAINEKTTFKLKVESCWSKLWILRGNEKWPSSIALSFSFHIWVQWTLVQRRWCFLKCFAEKLLEERNHVYYFPDVLPPTTFFVHYVLCLVVRIQSWWNNSIILLWFWTRIVKENVI